MSSEAFRQVDEKHVSSEVDHMLWSPKIDLVALSNVQGEVSAFVLEGNVLFNDALNTFHLRLCGVRTT